MKLFKLDFLGGRGGGAKQKPSMGGVWIFSGTTHYNFMFSIQFKVK